MCVIVYKPRGRTVKKEVYENCFNNNKDGAGFIVREKTGELKLEKGFFTFKDFWEHFQPHQSKQAIVHFRIATHGEKDQENCHPYWVNDNKLAFAHNGVMNHVDCSKDTTRSDTWHFNASMLKHLQDKMGMEFVFDPVMQVLIGEYIRSDKLAFIHEDSRAVIFNKDKGTMEDGVWFSNWSFRDWNKQSKKNWKKEYKNWEKAFSKQASNQPMYPYPALPFPSTPKPVIPVRLAPPMSSTLKINDYIEMIQPYRDLTGMEVGLVIAVYGNRTAEIKIRDARTPTGWKIRNLPFEVFKIYSTEEQQERDFGKEADLILLENKHRKEEGKVIEGEVLSSSVTKLDERPAQTLEEAACNDFRENYLH